jgi:hypothetical protein
MTAVTARRAAARAAVGQDGHATYFGGELSEIALPHVRFFDVSRRKREVVVSVQVFYGIGQHYHVTLKQQGNPIWNRRHRRWQRPRYDKHDGRSVGDKFDTYKEAETFIRRVLRWVFPNHRAIRDDCTGRRWFYKRDGD